MTATAVKPSRPIRKRRGSQARREALQMYLCLSPWLIGLVVFTLGPLIASLVLSFSNWKMLKPPVWVGLDNYVRIFTSDRLFVKSLTNTLFYALGAIPLQLVGALTAAVLLNTGVRGQGAFRTCFYIPSVFSTVATAVMFWWVFHPKAGLINWALDIVGIEGPKWLVDSRWAMPSVIVMTVWGSLGGPMIVFLAGLQGVPQHLYEAAEVDGANWLDKLRKITLPMISSVIFFNIVMGFVNAFGFSLFTAPYILTGGGPAYATYTYTFKIYEDAFQNFRMGYACALAWILFVMLVGVTVLQFRLGRRWVYYEGETVGKR